MTHYVKVREAGRKTWKFLARNGTTRARVHAARFTAEKAAQCVADIYAENAGAWDAKAVPLAVGA